MIIPSEIEPRVLEELDRDETVVWSGRPQPSLFAGRNPVTFLFPIFWVGFIFLFIFASHSGRNAGSPWPFMLPFFVIGFVFLSQPFFLYLDIFKTYYLITNRRALIVKLGRTKSVNSFYPEKLQSLERRERSNGKGDVVLERSLFSSNGYGYRGSSYNRDIGFMNIPDVKNVEGLLRDLAMKKLSGGSPQV